MLRILRNQLKKHSLNYVISLIIDKFNHPHSTYTRFFGGWGEGVSINYPLLCRRIFTCQGVRNVVF